ncbi:putative leucine-rich repeat receptor-like serine/threonine-protein kinase [Cucumis melo var. makuwa]|uniref:Leucine-rich repeat receptor-like serine/threonine-protein kinase n=1 Tax=Cucumis melo var. makuwa TaxID=1194695 RepID=A0A5A7SSR8_CUCMM|nr:putative leucine-rich repeat receptor-like serine/threonine-protein kinase [Cucumis melo var. makuwa]
MQIEQAYIKSGLKESKKFNRYISEERLRTREGGVEGGQAREHSALPKCDMARYTKSIRKRIPTTKTFMFCAIVKKTIEASTWLKFSVFMRMQENKASTSKNFKVRVVGRSTI